MAERGGEEKKKREKERRRRGEIIRFITNTTSHEVHCWCAEERFVSFSATLSFFGRRRIARDRRRDHCRLFLRPHAPFPPRPPPAPRFLFEPAFFFAAFFFFFFAAAAELAAASAAAFALTSCRFFCAASLFVRLRGLPSFCFLFSSRWKLHCLKVLPPA